MLPPPSAENLALPDTELALLFWQGWIELLLQRRGLSLADLTPDIAEHLRVVTLGMDGDNEAMAGEEKFLRRIASGDLEAGAGLIRQYYKRKVDDLRARDEAKTGRRRQRARAQMPRSNALQRIILRIVQANPDITNTGLVSELRAMADRDSDEIHEINEGSITIADNADEAGRSYPLSGLPDRLSRAKKKLRNERGK